MNPQLLAPGSMTWMLGIEDTCVYPADGAGPGPVHVMSPLDEHLLTDHHLHWREDLTAATQLGATAVRYGMSWPLVHQGPGRFDWSVLDEVVDVAVTELGLDLVADLVHYGAPTWLRDSFADPGFPDALAEFAGALARRYRGRIRAYTPVNEPLTTGSFSGLRGVWPPHRTGWRGWTSVSVPIAVAVARATHAIRAADPHALVVHVEAATCVSSTDRSQEQEAALLTQIGWLPTDLVLGRVDDQHPMRAWLLEHGADTSMLAELRQAPGVVDVLGVNYYPDLTPRRLRQVGDRVLQVAYDGGAERFATALRGFAGRYHLPLAVTETSIEGDDEARSRWLRTATEVVADLAAELDIRGFTWWPLLDFVDWSWAAHGRNVEEFAVETADPDGTTSVAFTPALGTPSQGKTPFLRRMGLLRLDERPDGSLGRHRTRAADAYAELAILDRVTL